MHGIPRAAFVGCVRASGDYSREVTGAKVFDIGLMCAISRRLKLLKELIVRAGSKSAGVTA